MICPVCQSGMKDREMLCRNCVQLKAKRMAVENLPAFASDIRLNRLAMLLRRRTKNNSLVEHIAVMQFHNAAFCGADLSDFNYDRRALLRELPESICRECEIKLNELLLVRAAGAER